jgi:2,5-diketo-D-gluconate reductase A
MLAPMIPLQDGRSIPQIGLGCAFPKGSDTAAVVRTAIEVGYRHVDTAKAYRSDAAVGEGVRTGSVPRAEIFVTSKLYCDDQGYDATLAAFDADLKRMGLDYLDLYLIHWPNPEIGQYVGSWRAMIRLRDEERIKSIGVSNFEPEHIERLVEETGVVPVINQVELNPRFQQKAFRDAMSRRGVVTESWGPLGNGKLLDDPVFSRIARKHGLRPAQVVLRWHTQNGLVTIPKADRRKWMEENLAIFAFTLDDEDMAQLGALDQGEPGRVFPHPAKTTLQQRKEMFSHVLAQLGP